MATGGYRARTIRTVAKLFAGGRLPLADWAQAGQFDLIRRSLGDIWGLGPYSIAHMLVLLGDFSEIPVDSIALRHLRDMHFNGRPVSAKVVVRPYEAYGKFQFLAYRFSRMAWRRRATESK